MTGYSAGGFAAAQLADDVFTNYFPDAENKNVLIDASLLKIENSRDIVENVWEAPESIASIIATPAVWLPFEEQGQSIAGCSRR